MRRMKFNSVLFYIANMLALDTCTTEKQTTKLQVMINIPQGFALHNQFTIFCYLCKLSLVLFVNFSETFCRNEVRGKYE